jgi:hypothetical protein
MDWSYNLALFYFGFSLALFGRVTPLMWQFYAITIPTLILFNL